MSGGGAFLQMYTTPRQSKHKGQITVMSDVFNPRSMEYEGAGIDPARPTIYALQTVLHFNKKYLSDVQLPRTCIYNRLLYTLNSDKIRLINANTFFGMQKY